MIVRTAGMGIILLLPHSRLKRHRWFGPCERIGIAGTRRQRIVQRPGTAAAMRRRWDGKSAGGKSSAGLVPRRTVKEMRQPHDPGKGARLDRRLRGTRGHRE